MFYDLLFQLLLFRYFIYDLYILFLVIINRIHLLTKLLLISAFYIKIIFSTLRFEKKFKSLAKKGKFRFKHFIIQSCQFPGKRCRIETIRNSRLSITPTDKLDRDR